MLTEILSAVVAGIIVWIATRYFINDFQMDGLRKVRVFEPQDNQLNKKFYNYFCKQIEKASDEILITGEGFKFIGKDIDPQVRAYHESVCKALVKGVHITRIQTAKPLHPQWVEMLRDLFDVNKGKFHLYIINNQEFHDIASVCVIDPDRGKRNVVEFMLSAEKDLEDKKARLASTGVFLHGRSDLASAMKKNIFAMKEFAITTQCRSKEDLDRFVKDYE